MSHVLYKVDSQVLSLSPVISLSLDIRLAKVFAETPPPLLTRLVTLQNGGAGPEGSESAQVQWHLLGLLVAPIDKDQMSGRSKLLS